MKYFVYLGGANYYFSELIRRYRLKHKLSQRELANKCGLTRANIMHIEAGNQRIFADQLFDVAYALNIPRSEITELLEYF